MNMEFILGILIGVAASFLFFHFHFTAAMQKLMVEIQSIRQKLMNK